MCLESTLPQAPKEILGWISTYIMAFVYPHCTLQPSLSEDHCSACQTYNPDCDHRGAMHQAFISTLQTFLITQTGALQKVSGAM